MQTRVPEKESQRDLGFGGSFGGSEFVEVCDEVDIMCVQIVIELYMLCKIHKEDAILDSWTQSCRFCKKT